MTEKQKDLPLEKEEGARSFAVFIRDASDGDIERDTSLEWWGLLTKLRATFQEGGGKSKGKMTLTLTATFDGKKLTIGSAIAVTAPKKPRAEAVAWLTPGDNYTFSKPRDPRQIGLFEANGARRQAEAPPAPAVNDE